MIHHQIVQIDQHQWVEDTLSGHHDCPISLIINFTSVEISHKSNGLRGYCTPDQFFDCLCIFLKNYNTLVTSKICFLKVTFQGTQLLHWNFTKSSGY